MKKNILIALCLSVVFAISIASPAFATGDIVAYDNDCFSVYPCINLANEFCTYDDSLISEEQERLIYKFSCVDFHRYMTSEERQQLINSNPVLNQYQKEHLLSIPVTMDEQILEIMNNPWLSQEQQDFFISRLFAMLDPGTDRDYIINLLPTVIRSHVSNLCLNSNLLEFSEGMIQEEWYSVDTHGEYNFFEPLQQPIQVTLPVRHFVQVERNWCGPATAQQTLDFFGRSYTQRVLAEAMYFSRGGTSGGTDLASVRTAVNDRLNGSWHYSAPVHLSNRNTINSRIYVAMRFNRIPPMIRIQSVSGWPYTLTPVTSGHFINLSGMVANSAVSLRGQVAPLNSDTVTLVQITDPWIGSTWHNPGANGRMWLSFDVIFRAMTARQEGGLHRPNWSS